MADDTVIKGKIHYYGREQYYQAMQDTCLAATKKFGNDPVYRFYSALSQLLQGRTQEAIRQLQSLQHDREVMLGTLLALIHAHRRCQVVDREAVALLDSKLKEERKRASEGPLYYAGMFLFLSGRLDKAREYVDRMLKLNQEHEEGLVLKAWVELATGKESRVRNLMEYLDPVLQKSSRHMDALFAKAKFYENRSNYKESTETLNLLVVAYPGFTGPLVEKAKVNLSEQDWDQCLESANRVLSTDSHNIEAMKYRTLYALCRKGNYDEAAQNLRTLYTEMDRSEPNNAALFIHMAQLFSRLCGRNNLVLEETFMMASKAAKVDSGSAEYLTEVGYQCLLQGRNKEATRYYKNATKLDESSVAALTGIISCQLLDGQVDVAEQQLEFLKEVQRSLGGSPDILYLSAVLGRMKHQPSDVILALLQEAIDNHFKSHRGMSFGSTYLAALNPDFLLLIVNECLIYAPNQPSPTEGVGQNIPPVVTQALLVLETITRACPALLTALILSARLKFITGDVKGAAASLQHVLETIDSTSSEAHLLMAQIQLYQGNFKQAQQSLEVGLSYNFEVREQPTYHLVRARVLKKQGQYQEAINTLKNCLNITNTRPTTTKGSRNKPDMTVPDRAAVFLELCEVYRLNNQPNEAAQVMTQAMTEFQGTGEEIRLNIASADLALMRGDVDQALSLLRAIGPEQQYYLQARDKMASIYLNHLKDKRMFASCYREVIEKNPTPQSYLMLGDAYMSIQEPDRAIEVYEQALKRNPRDSLLACRMGVALVKTHQYGKAINYYKEAIKTGSSNQLRYDLAELQMRLKQYDKAEKAITQALEVESHNPTNLSTMLSQAKLLNLLAKVHERNSNYEQALATLSKGKEVQVKVLRRAQVELPDTVPDQRRLAGSMCAKMAEHAANQRDYERAIKLYKEALQHDPEHAPTLLALAKLYMQTNDLDQCQYTCMTLLRTDKENDSATVMMADLSYRRNEYDTAMFHFQQLLDRRPDYFPALARLVEVMRRTGTLDEAGPYLDRSEQAVLRANVDPGYNFCRGLYEWYLGNPNSALKYFNKARKDQEWGQKAIYNMIEICLNPDNETIGGETFESVDSEVNQSGARDTLDMAIRTADKLLKELNPKPGEQMISHQVLSNFLLLATKQKSSAEQALQEFMNVASQESYKEHVGAILGMATAYMILKQTPRARNQLKRLAKAMWNFEDAEYLERCWLLLADIYVQTGKYDMATELLKRVLQHNRSCMKAYEYMGFIMEKEQSYRDAAYNYEQAWKFSSNTNPMIGYKLAFNYMKARRFVDAIDVCHNVLAKHPEYPRIRKDILDKSRASIRI
ncbi:tetratricopeptide repeat protein 21B-like [Eriocheir sinensis]|uniref:tetratricopeptide repeat protein 21B-like n=1 Tax=Eriocheir sinensis TaxID=95602 RepID=UPI0021C6089A|nr:tetratricopeptide repeat protein 21B-like [Eriocheir sinensis]